MSQPEPDATAPASDAAPGEPQPTADPAPPQAPAAEAAPAADPVPPADPVPAPAPTAPAVPAPAPAEATAVPAPAPAAPADPWAAPSAAPAVPAAPGGGPAPTGWAAVPPAAASGFQPGFPYPPAPAPLNGPAVASLVTGLTCLWPVAFVLSIVALVRIRRSGERGTGLAVAGLVLSKVGLVATVAFVLFGLVAVEETGEGTERARPAPKGSVSWSSLKSGDCYDPAPGEPDRRGGDPDDDGAVQVDWVVKVPCAQPHHAEVAGTVRVPAEGSVYPGEARLAERAGALCAPVLYDYALDSWVVPEDVGESYVYPSRGAWAAGEEYITCVWEDPDARHKGSVRTDRAALTPAQLAYLEAARVYNEVWAAPPEDEVAEALDRYTAWSARMAAASRTEAEGLSRAGVPWPEAARKPLAEVVAVKKETAAAWDEAGRATDVVSFHSAMTRIRILESKSYPLLTEIRGELGLSTGRQADASRV